MENSKAKAFEFSSDKALFSHSFVSILYYPTAGRASKQIKHGQIMTHTYNGPKTSLILPLSIVPPLFKIETTGAPKERAVFIIGNLLIKKQFMTADNLSFGNLRKNVNLIYKVN